MSWFKKVKGKCVDTYNPRDGFKYGICQRSLSEDIIKEEVNECINHPTILNPSSNSCFIFSENKERRNRVLDEILLPYQINAQQNSYSSNEDKDQKGNILVFEMPDVGGVRKAEEFIVKSLAIDEVDGLHKCLSMTLNHAISLQHTFKALVVKNVENILKIPRCGDRYQILATLVNIQNEFGRPTIFTGNLEGVYGIAMTGQHESRFLRNTFIFRDEFLEQKKETVTRELLLDKSSPISLNTEEVKSILTDKRTQIRKPVGYDITSNWNMEHTLRYSKYEKGDTLFVRESFVRNYRDVDGYSRSDNPEILYRADGENIEWLDESDTEISVPWKPSTNMPKSYARIFLEVTEVRVERLQTIDSLTAPDGYYMEGIIPENSTTAKVVWAKLKEEFISNWDKKSKKSFKWSDNPYVFVYTFKVIECPVSEQ